jgi:hypothetical protein
MNKYICLLINSILILGCSSSPEQPFYETTSHYEPPEYYIQIIDSTNIVASVQSIDYPWNTEGHLVDLQRKYETRLPFISPFSINLSFENIQPDTFSIYFCLINDGKCLKVAEKYFDGGWYSLGFQKLIVDAGWYEIKFIGKDVEYSQTYIFAP